MHFDGAQKLLDDNWLRGAFKNMTLGGLQPLLQLIIVRFFSTLGTTKPILSLLWILARALVLLVIIFSVGFCVVWKVKMACAALYFFGSKSEDDSVIIFESIVSHSFIYAE